MRARWTVILGAWLAAAGVGAAPAPAPAPAPPPVLKHSDVVFMYAAADEASYKAYGATFVAWGGANTAAEVKRHRDLGIRCTGSMWCLTAGAENLAKDPALHDAVAKDIEGTPIEVSAAVEGDVLVIEVADRGPGVAPADLDRLFEKFFRAGEAAGRPGAGLGLAISRGIVRLHGGEIRAGNRPGGGAVFRFWLPLGGNPPATAGEASLS